jgi:hypothetical protein
MGEWLAQTPMTRSARKALNNEGIKFGGSAKSATQEGKWRSDDLELFDSYIECRQYENLLPWEQKEDSGGDYQPIRTRKPRVNYAFGRVLVDRVGAKLFGDNVFPILKVEDDPDTQTYIQFVLKAAKLRAYLVEVAKKMLGAGSSFLRFWFVEGKIQVETYKSKYCYPEFQENGELESVRIQYVYDDFDDKDKDGNPKQKWYKLVVGTVKDTLFSNPEYKEGSEPEFTTVSSTNHNFGYVQGQWFKTPGGHHNTPDGYSIIGDLLEFIDELNYSVSQTSQAVQYNQEPLLGVTGISEDETPTIVKSSTKAMNLGREGKAAFIETNLEGVKVALEARKELQNLVQNVARVVFLDPEKMAAHAQSGRAMEIMNGPLVELINELRPYMEPQVIELVLKISISYLVLHNKGIETDVMIPDGWQPASLNISCHWPPVFAMTLDDLKSKVQMAVQAAGASLFSRETLTRWLAEDFHVEDIEGEIEKINDQPILNPFGGGFMDGPGAGGGSKPPPGK